jgi:hypothetical protein
LRTRTVFTGEFPGCKYLVSRLTESRFRDIGYQHIPFFNCPNSPKCKGCVTGRFTDGEAWLNKEDCRPNYFKFVGMG